MSDTTPTTPNTATPTPDTGDLSIYEQVDAILAEDVSSDETETENTEEPKAEEPKVEEEPKEEESKEEESKEEPKEEDKPNWKIIRQRMKKLDKREAELSQREASFQEAYKEVEENASLINSFINEAKTNPVKFWDKIIELSGVDKYKAFRDLAESKIGTKKAPDPEVTDLKKEIQSLREELKQKEEVDNSKKQQNNVRQLMVNDHNKVLEVVLTDVEKYPYASGLSTPELNQYVKQAITWAYAGGKARLATLTHEKIAESIDKYEATKYARHQERQNARVGKNPVGKGQQNPSSNGRKPLPLTKEDGADARNRIKTRDEELAEADELLRAALNEG